VESSPVRSATRGGALEIESKLHSGSKIVDPTEDKDLGGRFGGVQDRFGHIWYIAMPLKNASH
jgi:uncharacterized glyoxalase superfamily protein PhnB